MRLRRLKRWWPAVLGVLIILFVSAAIPGKWTLTVSPETTFVTEPVDAEGFVDYPTALNERLRQGITPETNANVLIWKALGPRPEGATMPPAYFQWLGIESPPEQGDYFIDSDKFFERQLKDRLVDVQKVSDSLQKWRDRVDWAIKWPWKRSEYPNVADWLKQNEKPLAVLIEASKRPEYFNPLISKSADPRTTRIMNSLLPSAQKCRAVCRALSCRAMGRIGDGDFDGAWQDLLACQRLGRLIGRSGTLIESLVGVALVANATSGQITLVSHSKHPSKQVLAWLDDLQKLPPMRPFADKLDLGERFQTLDSLQSIVCCRGDDNAATPGQPPRANGFWDRAFTRGTDFDPAFRNANRAFDDYVAAARQSDRGKRKDEVAAISARFDQAARTTAQKGSLAKLVSSRAERGEHIGNVMIALLLPSIEKVLDSGDRTEQTQTNLQIAFALAAYRADQGKYPPRLDELAPKYLSKIPLDLFSGKPLIYRPAENGYLLYSVGVNGIDEDGRWTDDDPKGDDLRVRMPVTEPPRK
ncbi:MAG TPA: hypothetical protein VKD71_15240 [Gemmataceae bacterium]|nr:hypothetical protein [Gemmataceae bacterium]